MSKTSDKAQAYRIKKNGFVLPDEVEQFFTDAKARAIKTIMNAREMAKERLSNLSKNGKAMYESLPVFEKKIRKLDQNHKSPTFGFYIEVELDFDTWLYYKQENIYKQYPFHGYTDDRAIEMVKDEYNWKRAQFIIRVFNIVGEHVRGSSLYIDPKSGDVNGTIWGDDGRASVKTIGAGGYNIQCYHFRCLIHKLPK